jgi:hypothetical protein
MSLAQADTSSSSPSGDELTATQAKATLASLIKLHATIATLTHAALAFRTLSAPSPQSRDLSLLFAFPFVFLAEHPAPLLAHLTLPKMAAVFALSRMGLLSAATAVFAVCNGLFPKPLSYYAIAGTVASAFFALALIVFKLLHRAVASVASAESVFSPSLQRVIPYLVLRDQPVAVRTHRSRQGSKYSNPAAGRDRRTHANGRPRGSSFSAMFNNPHVSRFYGMAKRQVQLAVSPSASRSPFRRVSLPDVVIADDLPSPNLPSANRRAAASPVAPSPSSHCSPHHASLLSPPCSPHDASAPFPEAGGSSHHHSAPPTTPPLPLEPLPLHLIPSDATSPHQHAVSAASAAFSPVVRPQAYSSTCPREHRHGRSPSMPEFASLEHWVPPAFSDFLPSPRRSSRAQSPLTEGLEGSEASESAFDRTLDTVCLGCFEALATVVGVPCGHVTFCRSCAQAFVEAQSDSEPDSSAHSQANTSASRTTETPAVSVPEQSATDDRSTALPNDSSPARPRRPEAHEAPSAIPPCPVCRRDVSHLIEVITRTRK